MFNRRILIAAITAMTAAGCNFHTTLPKSDDALNAEARGLYAELVDERDDELVARMASENDLEAVRAQLPMLRNMIGHESTPEPQVAGYQKTRSTQGQFYVVNQDYPYPDRVVRATTTFKREGGDWKVLGFNINVDMRAVSFEEAAEEGNAPPEA